MKKIPFLFVATIATFMCLNSVYANFPKVPLLEKFTATWCGPCASYNNSVFNAWKNANKDRLAIINYHLASGDPMGTFAPNIGPARAQQYAIPGVPHVRFEGAVIGGGQPTASQLNNALGNELAETSPVRITPTITVNGGTATVNVEVLSTQAMSGVRLQVLILQEQVSFATPPGSNGEKEFSFVARFAFPNMNGENLTLTANQAVNRQHTANIGNVPQSGRFYVVAFLERTSPHSIVQAGISAKTEHITLPMISKNVVLQVSHGNIYGKIAPGAAREHVFLLQNPNNFPIKVTATVEQGSNWSNTGLSANNVSVAPYASVPVYITATAPNAVSSNLIVIELLAEYDGPLNDTNYVHYEDTVSFFTMTDNVKYAYITNLGSHPVSVEALNSTTHFNGELISIPFISGSGLTLINNMNQAQLFSDLEFLGLSFLGQNLAVALHNNTQIASIITDFHNKGGKLYMENYKNFYEINNLKNQYPAIFSAMEQLFKNCFGTWNTNGNEFIISQQQGQQLIALPLPITGVDTEISKGQSYTLNQEQPLFGYAEMINHLEPGATRVFNGPNNVCAMARFEKGNARSVHSGVRIASFPAANRIAIANNIVNWLFPPPPPEFTVTIGEIIPADVGTVSGHGTFQANTSVTLTATPNNPAEYKFVNWTNTNGAVVSEANPYIFTLTQNITLNANFALIPPEEFTVTIGGIVPEGTGTVSGNEGTFVANSECTLTATPISEEYEFDGWRNAEGDLISEDNPYTFTVTQNVELFAHFGEVSVKDEHISLNSIFPNPTKDYLTIDLKENATVRIFTLDGVKLFEENRSEGISNINFNLPSGTYILKTETAKGSAVTKFIVE